MRPPVVTLAGRHSAPVFAALHALCFPGEAWGQQPMADLLSTPGTLGFLLNGPGSADEPDGLALVRLALDEAEILTFGVKPEVRGRGRAGQLLDIMLETLAERGIREVFLEVAVDNFPARKLYGLRGFFEIGRRVGYYVRGSGACVDALRLKHVIASRAMVAGETDSSGKLDHGPDK